MKKTQNVLYYLFFLGLVFLNFNVEAKTKPSFFTKAEKANVTAKGFKSKDIKPNMKMANVIIVKNKSNNKKFFAPVTCTQTVTSMMTTTNTGTASTIVSSTTSTVALVEPTIGTISKTGDNLIIPITHATMAANASLRIINGTNTTVSNYPGSTPITYVSPAGSLVGGKTVSISGRTILAGGCQSDFSIPVNFVVPFDAPTNLTGTGISPVAIRLNYIAVAPHPTLDTYEWRVAPLGGTYGPLINNGVSTTIIDNGKTANTTYTYQVRAKYLANAALGIANAGVSDWITVNVTTPGFLPVTALNASTNNCTRINLSWTAPTVFTGYACESHDIWRSENGGPAKLIAERYPNTNTSFTDTKLASSTTYSYYLVSIYADGRSLGSNIGTATTSPFTARLISKSGSTATIGFEKCSPDIEAFVLFGSTNGGATFEELGRGDSQASQIQARGLTQNTNYSFFVRGKFNGSEPISNLITTKTDLLPQPTNAKLTLINKNSVKLDWDFTQNEFENAEAFLIYTPSKVANEPDSFVQIDNSQRSYTVTNLKAGQEVCYYIVARYATAFSSPTPVLCNVTCPEPIVSFSTVEALSPTKVKLNWVPTTNDSPTEVVVEFSEDKVSWGALPKVTMQTATITDENLSPNTLRFYRAVTINKGTCKGFESEIFTAIGCPSKPQNVKANGLTSTSLEVTWNTIPNATAYNIERSINNIVFTKVGTAKGTDVKFVDINLAPSTVYYYRISADNISKCTSELSTVTLESFATTCPTAPTGVVASAVSSKEIKFSFVDNAPDEEGFEVQISTDEKTWTKVGNDLPKNSTSLNVTTNILPETKYFFRVITIGKTCKSDPSLTASVVTNPPAPTGLSAKGVKINQIDLTWTNTAKTASGIEIQKAANTDNNYTKDGDTPATTNAYSSKGLNAATNYKYRVRYNSPSGVSDWSNIADATTILISANEDNVLNNQIMLSPVPATDFVTIKSEIAIAGKVEATIVNANGKTVSASTFNGLNIGKIETINIQKLSQGIYFLEVKTNKGTVTKKFMKQ